MVTEYFIRVIFKVETVSNKRSLCYCEFFTSKEIYAKIRFINKKVSTKRLNGIYICVIILSSTIKREKKGQTEMASDLSASST